MRREWDSNPRYGFPYTNFPGLLLQPLGHLSCFYSYYSLLILYKLENSPLQGLRLQPLGHLSNTLFTSTQTDTHTNSEIYASNYSFKIHRKLKSLTSLRKRGRKDK